MKTGKHLISIAMLVFCVSGSCGAQEQSEVEQLNQNYFPAGFRFGVATASYQIEGAWNTSGKGENIWDRFTRLHPYRITDRSNGNIACDSYHKFKEDVQLVKSLNVSFYRFSLSWSRILPTGYTNLINPDGIRYYNELIDELLAHDLAPVVTIYHWDLPHPLQEIGGWPNPELAQHYVNFARVAFTHFGDRVKTWITINEPKQICKMGYGDAWLAPSMTASGIGDYMCTYTLLKAHAEAYHLYNDEFKPTQNGIIGITMDSFWFEPASNSSADDEAAKRMFDFYTGVFSNPIFSEEGDYPQTMKEFVAARSLRQNFPRSRLPVLTTAEVSRIRGTSDFFGLNFYTSLIVADAAEEDLSKVDWDSDMRVAYWWDEKWEQGASWWLRVTPWGLRNTLIKLNSLYKNIPIYITENGFSDLENIEDYGRANYYLRYLSACLEAIHDHGVNLQVYTAWSLLDNFEWTHGYVNRFGMHHVDFNDPNRPRTPKLSSKIYTEVVKNRRLPNTTLPLPDGSAMKKPLSLFVVLYISIMCVLYIRF